MGPRQPNQKAVAAKERKAAHAASKDAAAAKVNAAAEAAEWNKGSNVRSANRAAEAAAKADEAARKKREKADLLAAEEAAGAGAPSKAKKSGTNSKKKDKKKKKNELELLEEALVGNAEKQAKAAKKKERERKEREERMQMERDKLAKQKAALQDPLFANTHAMIGSMDDNGQDDVKVGRAANRANAEALSASSIEGALSALSTGGEEDQHPEKRMKALHKAFEERMLPEMKQQYPGLRLGQYKDKIFQLWKKSPENPMNQPRPVLKS